MFLKGLTEEEQKAFLNLAYTMVYADNNLAPEEKKLFDSYMTEVEVDLPKAHKVDFDKELDVFAGSTDETKTGIFFELYAIALIDRVYADEEKVLVDIAQKKLGVTDEKKEEMKVGLHKLMETYEDLRKIIYKE